MTLVGRAGDILRIHAMTAAAAAAAAAKCGVRGQYMSNHLGDKPRYPAL